MKNRTFSKQRQAFIMPKSMASSGEKAMLFGMMNICLHLEIFIWWKRFQIILKKTENIFSCRQAFAYNMTAASGLMENVYQSNTFSNVYISNIINYYLWVTQMLSACQLMVVLWGTDVLTSFGCYSYFIIYFNLITLLLSLFIFCLEPLYVQMLWCWGCYLFIFNSGMECNTLSLRCGRLYFPIFLFRVGLFILMYMASLMALTILCPSLPMILKFSTMLCSQCCSGAQK